jgi:DNA-binding XRE family transcriptional regulator
MRLYWTHVLRMYEYRRGTSAQRRMLEIRFALARTLRAKRRDCRVTQAQLAKAIGAAQQTISEFERLRLNISIDYFVRSMIALNASDEDIAAAFNASAHAGIKQLRYKTALPLFPRPQEQYAAQRAPLSSRL